MLTGMVWSLRDFLIITVFFSAAGKAASVAVEYLAGKAGKMKQPKPLHRGRPFSPSGLVGAERPIEIAKEQPFDCSFT